jgi:sugar phosphate isomerase/epimerase
MDHVLPNVEWLAGKVEDVQLLLVEPDSDLPSREDVLRLKRIHELHGNTYTVHLPTLKAVDGEKRRHSVETLARVIDLTRPADPLGWTLHVGPSPVAPDTDVERWHEWAVTSVLDLGQLTGVLPHHLRVENLYAADLAPLRRVVSASGCQLCLDVGHVVMARGRPLDAARDHLPVTGHIHLHGVTDRDHRSVAHFPDLSGFLALLEATRFDGVLTMEVFGKEDFESSLEAYARAAREVTT